MKRELTSQDIVDRSHQAATLLNDPTLQKAFEGVRQAILVKIEECPLGDVDTQHELAISLQLLKQLRRQLHNWLTDGQLETAKASARDRISQFTRKFTA